MEGHKFIRAGRSRHDLVKARVQRLRKTRKCWPFCGRAALQGRVSRQECMRVLAPVVACPGKVVISAASSLTAGHGCGFSRCRLLSCLGRGKAWSKIVAGSRSSGPQRLKPPRALRLCGTTEAVPFHQLVPFQTDDFSTGGTRLTAWSQPGQVRPGHDRGGSATSGLRPWPPKPARPRRSLDEC